MRKDGHNPVLIVIAGPNGSGKTTVTSQLLKSDWLEDAIYMIQPLFRLADGILGKMYVKSLPDWASNILPENEIQIQDSEISD